MVSYYSGTSNDNTWTIWCDSASTTSTTSAGCWENWNSPTATITSTATATSDTIWVSWNNDQYTQCVPRVVERPMYQQESEEQKRRNQEQRDRWAAERKEREIKTKKLKEERKQAEIRAKELLLDMIGEKELKVYNETGRLFVKGNKYDWLIKKGGILTRIEKNSIRDICIHLDNRHKYPETDNVVAMKLLIESDEKSVSKIGNLHSEKPKSYKLPKAACM